ncbi:MAG: bifunctional sulfate adenylyltransferase/adenylylsulfate kinase [Acidobacteria bacterium]|nr:bifunctional sulfate adenylyltransferase/adenylylsulfate kinase [Acidobacteriota bacterium]
MSTSLVPPHGGDLLNLMASPERADELKAQAREMPSWSLTARQVADLELLLNGAFSPLRGFMGRDDHEAVCRDLSLADGTFWPLPVTLDVSEQTGQSLAPGSALALRDVEGTLLAVLHVEEAWAADHEAEAIALCGTGDPGQPCAGRLLRETGAWYLGGRVEGVAAPHHYDFVERRASPAELRERFTRWGWRRIAAFHTREVMHRAEQELTFAAARDLEAALLVQLDVARTDYYDVSHYSRIRCAEALMKTYPHGTAALNLLPLARRGSGARDILLNAVVAQSYGCSHHLVRSAAPGADDELLGRADDALAIELVRTPERVYLPDRDAFVGTDAVPEGAATKVLTSEELEERLARGRELPSWFSFPEVVRELRRSAPPRSRQGFTVFFSGLPSSGKSTLANVLLVKLLEMGGRPVTLLDGDIVRQNLSSELGFSREHRNLNVARIGFVASEITKNGGIALCAPIAPYDAVRKQVRSMIEPVGGFLLVHVATPLGVCETRDRKGLYAKARAGIVKEFTGISDPYEEPKDAGMVIDTAERSPEECVQAILLHLEKEGYIGRPSREKE